MNERLRGYLFIIFCFMVFWLTIILLCLPQTDNELDQWPLALDSNKIRRNTNEANHVNYNKSKYLAPYAPHYMKSFLSWPSKLDLRETLFYQFNTNSGEFGNLGNNKSSFSKSEHDKETLKFGNISTQIDEFVKLEGDKLFAFNLLISNRIGASRKLPDTRHHKCPRVEEQISSADKHYADQAETLKNITHHKASIIICYYNEAPSALLRTINSITQRSPEQLIEEIIILDDHSQPGYEVDQIEQYFDTTKIKIITERTSRREGLIRARLYGASLAKGDVLIFLDSHIEANIGWLEPLILTVQERNGTTIACPMIDLINAETLIYSASPMVKGGLKWNLNFKWDSVPSDKLISEDDFIKPIDSPTMAGGLYAIRRDYFYKLGAYDKEMELWGGENVEMSLRIWMCGGRIVILPCSRIGHIFRKKRPYGPEPDQPDSLLVNSHRTAIVWLDEYIENYYEHQPLAKSLKESDTSERQQLRKDLNCHNFTWFLENIYPALNQKDNESKPSKSNIERVTKLFKPNGRRFDRRSADGLKQIGGKNMKTSSLSGNELIGSFHYNRIMHYPIVNQLPEPIVRLKFQLQLTNSNLCLQAKEGLLAEGFRRLVLGICISNPDRRYLANNGPSKGLNLANLSNQLWIQTEMNDLRLGHNQCLDLLKNQPLLRRCHNMGSTQEWTAQMNQTLSTHILNAERKLCLAVEKIQIGEPVIVTICDKVVEEYRTTNQLKSFRGTNRGNMQIVNGRWMTGPMMAANPTNFDHIEQSLMLQPLEPYQRWNLLIY